MSAMNTGPFFLGIDGGGSRCRARVRDVNGTLLAEATGGASNIYQDFRGALATIMDTSRAAAQTAGVTTQQLHAGLGIAGIVTSVGAEKVVEAALPFASVSVNNDAYAACVGAFGGGDGGIVIAGTGSIGFALVGGQRHMVGGTDDIGLNGQDELAGDRAQRFRQQPLEMRRERLGGRFGKHLVGRQKGLVEFHDARNFQLSQHVAVDHRRRIGGAHAVSPA